MTLSIIIPIYNEEENIGPLYEGLVRALSSCNIQYEIIFIDDGSCDGSAAALSELTSKDSKVKLINFRHNFGQTAAMMAGIDYASGDVIIPMDGDLQNDPADIPKLLAKLDEGYDVVSGWRKNRKDSALIRNFPSHVANWLISKAFGVKLHDYGCSLKAYRKDVLKEVRLYGEMHRFIPVYASWQGGKVTEIPVDHHPRLHGNSHYGLERVMKVLLDLVVLKFLVKYANKPIYVFGGFGLISIAISFATGLFAVYLKIFEAKSFISTPLPLLVVMAFITGIMSILMGLLSEVIMRTYYEAQHKQVYVIRDTVNLDTEAH